MRHEKRDFRITVAITTIIVFVMFSFSFVLAPLYNALCKATGLNGRVDISNPAASVSQEAPDATRQFTLQFVATNNANLPWDFYPKKNSLEIHPEENVKMLFVVKNNSQHTMTVQAIPSITPWQAAKHLHKIQCFCFTQQTLAAGQTLEMPVVLRIDKDLPPDIKTVTLSYTLFDVTQQKRKSG